MTLLFKLGTGNILIGISILVKGVQLVLKVEEKVTRISILADVSHMLVKKIADIVFLLGLKFRSLCTESLIIIGTCITDIPSTKVH